MFQNLRIRSAQYFEHNSPTAQLALVFGLVLVLADAVVKGPEIQLWVGLVYAIVGVTSLLLDRFLQRPYTRRLIFLSVGAAAGFGLLGLALEGVWELWALVVALALLPASPGLIRQSVHPYTYMAYAGMTVVAAVVGVVLSSHLDLHEGTAIAGISALVIGYGAFLLATTPVTDRRKEVQEFPVDYTTKEELDAMGIPLLATKDLVDLSMRIHVTVDGLVRAAQAINEVTTQQTANADEQTDFIDNTNSRMDNFLELSEQITERARQINRTAHQTTEISKDGKESLQRVMGGIEQIRTQVQAIGDNIVMLARLTQRIDEIITSVSEIATQSNMLALNASIEAARAGVHGRGFAVVAEEVRSLSQQSTNAAQQVRDILAEIQDAVRQTISATEAGVRGAEEGVKMAQQADAVMMQLTTNVDTTHEAVRSIYDVIREQADGLEEMAISIDRIGRITQENLASTRMVATVSTNLNRLAEDLQEVVHSSASEPSAVPTTLP